MTYFLSGCPLAVGEVFEWSGAEAHHAVGSRRIRPGEELSLQDPQGRRFRAALEGQSRKSLTVRVLAPEAVPPLPGCRVTLLQGAVKAKAAGEIVQKITELGVARLAFFPAERSTVSPRELESGKTQTRWERIAWEACKQCGRQFPPELTVAGGLAEALALTDPAAANWMFHPGEASAVPVLPAAKGTPAPASARLLVGPEGGWTAEEVRQAAGAGFRPVGLGGMILRAETAAVAACSLALFGPGAAD